MRTGEARFRAPVDLILDDVAIISDGAIAYVNQAATETLRFDKADLLEAKLSPLVASPNKDQFREFTDRYTTIRPKLLSSIERTFRTGSQPPVYDPSARMGRSIGLRLSMHSSDDVGRGNTVPLQQFC